MSIVAEPVLFGRCKGQAPAPNCGSTKDQITDTKISMIFSSLSSHIDKSYLKN